MGDNHCLIGVCEPQQLGLLISYICLLLSLIITILENFTSSQRVLNKDHKHSVAESWVYTRLFFYHLGYSGLVINIGVELGLSSLERIDQHIKLCAAIIFIILVIIYKEMSGPFTLNVEVRYSMSKFYALLCTIIFSYITWVGVTL